MSNNLNIWKHFGKTPEKLTKSFRASFGKTATTIDPMWQVRKMTDVFGPVGHGWGWINNPMIEGDIYIANVSVWTEDKDNIYGPFSVAKELKKNGRLDPHATKSAVTDALTKTFSHLGMCNDIFLGEFMDDPNLSEDDNAITISPREVEKDEKNIKEVKWTQDWNFVFDFRSRRLQEIDNLDGMQQEATDIKQSIATEMKAQASELYNKLVSLHKKRKQELKEKGGKSE
tara:strand:- start:825 stop:1511 length:687 start_codon:yes stop_codon:yes gene_type:complete